MIEAFSGIEYRNIHCINRAEVGAMATALSGHVRQQFACSLRAVSMAPDLDSTANLSLRTLTVERLFPVVGRFSLIAGRVPGLAISPISVKTRAAMPPFHLRNFPGRCSMEPGSVIDEENRLILMMWRCCSRPLAWAWVVSPDRLEQSDRTLGVGRCAIFPCRNALRRVPCLWDCGLDFTGICRAEYRRGGGHGRGIESSEHSFPDRRRLGLEPRRRDGLPVGSHAHVRSACAGRGAFQKLLHVKSQVQPLPRDHSRRPQ